MGRGVAGCRRLPTPALQTPKPHVLTSMLNPSQRGVRRKASRSVAMRSVRNQRAAATPASVRPPPTSSLLLLPPLGCVCSGGGAAPPPWNCGLKMLREWGRVGRVE